MIAVFRLCESDLKTDIDAGTDLEHLKHEVVYGLDEKFPKRGSRRHLFFICSEMLLSNI